MCLPILQELVRHHAHALFFTQRQQLLQGGMLTGKYRRGQEAPAGSRLAEKPEWMKPFTDETYDVIERCAAEAAAEGVTMTQHALRWALAQPGVVSALVGVKREEQIDEAAGAVR